MCWPEKWNLPRAAAGINSKRNEENEAGGKKASRKNRNVNNNLYEIIYLQTQFSNEFIYFDREIWFSQAAHTQTHKILVWWVGHVAIGIE